MIVLFLQRIKIATIARAVGRAEANGGSTSTVTEVGAFTCRQQGLLIKDLVSVIDGNMNGAVNSC